MPAEYQRTGIYQQTEIKKSDEKWHVDKIDVSAGIGAAGLLVAGHFLGETYTVLALILASVDLEALRSKAENVARSKK